MKIILELDNGYQHIAEGEHLEAVLEAVLKDAEVIGEDDSVRILSRDEEYVLDKAF